MYTNGHNHFPPAGESSQAAYLFRRIRKAKADGDKKKFAHYREMFYEKSMAKMQAASGPDDTFRICKNGGCARKPLNYGKR